MDPEIIYTEDCKWTLSTRKHIRSPHSIRRRGSNGAESRKGIGEAVKNVLNLKKKNRSLRGTRIRSYVYQVKRAAVFTHDLFPPRYPPSLPTFATHPSPDFILYFPLPVSRLPSLLRTPTIASRASIASLRGPEIPAKRTSRVSVRINFRKRKPVLEDYDHASQKKSNFRMRARSILCAD